MKFSWNKGDKWVLRFFVGFVGGTAFGTVIDDTNIGLILGIMLGTAFAKFTFKQRPPPPRAGIWSMGGV